MSTSGAYAFNPALGEFVIDAFGNCGVRRTELTVQHMHDARFAANLIMSRWTASGVNLWAVDQQSVALIQGQATYAVATTTIFILDAYLTQGTNPPTDTLIFPVSRSDYAAFADKTSQGTPTVFWFDRTDPAAQQLTLWQVPNQSNLWTLNYWRARQSQDSELTGGTQQEIPYTYLDAFSWELSARLAMKYAADKAVMLKGEAQEAWDIAVSSGTENLGVYILPSFEGYWR